MRTVQKAKVVLTAEDKTKKVLKKAEKNFKSFSSTIKKTIGIGAAVAAVRQLGRFAAVTLETAEAMVFTADKIGVTTDALQEYRYMARRTGLTNKQLDSSLQRFSRRVGEVAEGGGTLEKVMKKYKVDLREANGEMRKLPDILDDFADAVKGAESAQEQLRMNVQAFDIEGAGMVNITREGSEALRKMRQEAHDTAAILEENLARGAKKVRDEFGMMIDTILVWFQTATLSTIRFFEPGAFGGGISKEFIEAREELARLVDGIPALETALDNAKNAGEGATDAVKIYAAWLEETKARAAELREVIDGIGKPPKPVVISKVYVDAIAAMERQLGLLGKTTRYEQVLWETQSGRYAALKDHQKEELLAIAKTLDARQAGLNVTKKTDEYGPIIEGMKRQLDLLGETTELEQILWDIQNGRHKSLSDNQKNELIATAHLIDLKQAAIDAEEAWEEEQKALKDAAEGWLFLINPANQLTKELTELHELLEAGAMSWENYQIATQQVQDQYDDLGDKTKETTSKMSVFADQAARNMQSAFADFLFDPFDDGMKGMVRGFAETLKRMAADAIAAKLMEKMFGEEGEGGKRAGGGWWDMVLSFFGSYAKGSSMHDGGIAGKDGTPRIVKSSVFDNAKRYHSGVSDLASNEEPVILRAGELVGELYPMGRKDYGQAQPVNVRIMNMFDEKEIVKNAMSGAMGDRIILNAIQRNQTAVRQAVA